MIFHLFILALSVTVLISVLFDTIRNGISPTPTSNKVRQYILKTSHIYSPKPLNVFELGSGFGTLVFPLGRLYPNSNIYGIENAFLPYVFSRVRLLMHRNKNVRLHRKSFYHYSLQNANLIFCFLHSTAMKKLSQQFAEQLMPGTIIISHTFALPLWEPVETITVPDLYRTKIYIYKVP